MKRKIKKTYRMWAQKRGRTFTKDGYGVVLLTRKGDFYRPGNIVKVKITVEEQ